ncbi:MAG: hypothetical protein IJT96_12090 [Lachnospiraceae bacterium]|nr:hypothetical protein [Lachnospiraceae bacterium]
MTPSNSNINETKHMDFTHHSQTVLRKDIKWYLREAKRRNEEVELLAELLEGAVISVRKSYT